MQENNDYTQVNLIENNEYTEIVCECGYIFDEFAYLTAIYENKKYYNRLFFYKPEEFKPCKCPSCHKEIKILKLRKEN